MGPGHKSISKPLEVNSTEKKSEGDLLGMLRRMRRQDDMLIGGFR